MDARERDRRIRTAAFDFVRRLVAVHPRGIPWRALRDGFEFEGCHVLLMSQQGIFKPEAMPDLPLSISTRPGEAGRPSPYDDLLSDDEGCLSYAYRGTDPAFHENQRMRRACLERVPLLYFFRVTTDPVRYLARLVQVLAADDERLRFTLSVSELSADRDGVHDVAPAEAIPERRYSRRETVRRLHQDVFSDRVVAAYADRCAVCTLRRPELLDAAHIVPDRDPAGIPSVTNGLSLCKLHHAAYDGNLLGIRPDCVIEIRPDVLDEEDGPMLVHGIQGFHGTRLHTPRREPDRPDPERLERRYGEFRRAV